MGRVSTACPRTRDIDATTVVQVQAALCRRILHIFVGRGLLERYNAKEMLVDTRC
jgi:hypothetical protein